MRPKIWRDIKFCKKSSLCMVVDQYYDENDYLREYESFKKFLDKRISLNAFFFRRL